MIYNSRPAKILLYFRAFFMIACEFIRQIKIEIGAWLCKKGFHKFKVNLDKYRLMGETKVWAICIRKNCDYVKEYDLKSLNKKEKPQ